MNGHAELVAILHRLLCVEADGNPTIANIEAAIPNLRRLDWINRFGRADAWLRIASGLSTDHLERLVRIFVVAEREYNWLGGSVAAAIWLFRAYCERQDAHPDTLADWVLKNRGRNEYVPFGRMTPARSLDDWHVEQKHRAQRREIRRLREEEQKDTKARRTREAREQSEERKEASAVRHKNLLACVDIIQALTGIERLQYIATNNDLPLEFIPEDLIRRCVSVATSLDAATKHKLLTRIDRRRRKIWRDLRAAYLCP
jgi:hypothetical protein